MFTNQKNQKKMLIMNKNVNKTKQIKLQCYSSFFLWYVRLNQKECLLLFSSLLVLLLSDFLGVLNHF